MIFYSQVPNHAQRLVPHWSSTTLILSCWLASRIMVFKIGAFIPHTTSWFAKVMYFMKLSYYHHLSSRLACINAPLDGGLPSLKISGCDGRCNHWKYGMTPIILTHFCKSCRISTLLSQQVSAISFLPDPPLGIGKVHSWTTTSGFKPVESIHFFSSKINFLSISKNPFHTRKVGFEYFATLFPNWSAGSNYYYFHLFKRYVVLKKWCSFGFFCDSMIWLLERIQSMSREPGRPTNNAYKATLW